MKRIFILCAALCSMMIGFGQTDTTTKAKPDTIKIGGMVIIREKGKNNDDSKETKGNSRLTISNRHRGDKPSNISTNWWILDLGFSNYVDNSNYVAARNSNFVAPGIDENSLKLRTGKSRSVNIWFFMQRINMIKHVVNFKYGLGLELNNYHFDDKTIRFQKNISPTIDEGFLNSGLTKNKLAADYLTMPFMLNFNFTPKKHKRNYGFSAGISAGYLYSARQKIKEDGKVDKTKDNFDLRKWKLSYVGEVALGPIRLYGSYAFKSMFEKGLDVTPYNVGFRFSNW
ncbi:MAG: outer membrane beta-barrel protein [Chitinophagaceae bacterium]